MSDRLLLDTCAAIWLMNREPMSTAARGAIATAVQQSDGVAVSPVTAWEMALLVERGRLALDRSPLEWFRALSRRVGFWVLALTEEALTASCALPGPAPRDPMDRIILAVAREHGLAVVTRDRAILAYGEAGHVRVLAC